MVVSPVSPETEDALIPLSALQHHLFCPRQCALIHVEGLWAEDGATAEGRLLHERVDAGKPETRPGVRIARGLALRSLALGKKVRAKRRVAFRSFWSKLFRYETHPYPAYEEKTHYVDKPMALLSNDGVKSGTPRPQLVCTNEEIESVREKLAKLHVDRGYIVLSHFSVWGTKMWFADRFAQVGAELARRYSLPIVVIGGGGGPAEVLVGKTIAAKISSGGGKALTLVGQTSLGELKALIRGAKLLIANDSAPVHIAASFNIPTVAIFGPTARKWGFFPLSDESIVVERADISCRPCHIHGPAKCPKGHFRCMNDIQVEDVVHAVQNLIK